MHLVINNYGDFTVNGDGERVLGAILTRKSIEMKSRDVQRAIN